MTSKILVGFCVLALASAVPACGDDDDDTTPSSGGNAGRGGSANAGRSGGGGTTALGGSGGTSGSTSRGGTGPGGAGGVGGSSGGGQGGESGGGVGGLGGLGGVGGVGGAEAGAGGVGGAPVAAGYLNDNEIVQVLITANTGEVAAGTIASTRGQSAAVRDFGAAMVTEHGNALTLLATLVANESFTPRASKVSSQLQSDAEAEADELTSVAASAFDQTYMEAQVADHRAVLSLVTRMEVAADNGALESMLGSMRATVAEHLSQAEAILADL